MIWAIKERKASDVMHPEERVRASVTRLSFICCMLCVCSADDLASRLSISGKVTDRNGVPLTGVMITARQPELKMSKTVFTDKAGGYLVGGLESGRYTLRAKRLGYGEQLNSLNLAGGAKEDFKLSEKEDFSDDLPASSWFAEIPFASTSARERFKLDCLVCHQMGSDQTRKIRNHEEWIEVIQLMRSLYAQAAEGPMAAQLDRERVETLEAWSKAGKPHFLTPAAVEGEAAHAIITEFDIGRPDSYCHDLEVDRDGIVWAVDIGQDALYKLDPRTGKSKTYPIPAADNPKIPWSFSSYNTRVGPHSIESDQQGRMWITLSFGNKLAMFDPKTESFRIWAVPAPAIYPHTLRVDSNNNVWFTIYISGHIGKFDPKTEQFTIYTPPTPGGTHYGLAIAPDGNVWYSQLYGQRIGRLDPSTGSIKEFKTPGVGPRRLEVDSKGIVWVPEYGAGLLARFDPKTENFKEYELPTGRTGEAPYALGIDRADNVWICGTISDTIMKFDPRTSRFTVFPMPEKVTFTREIEFDYSTSRMSVWTISSNDPPTHIESKQPSVIRVEVR